MSKSELRELVIIGLGPGGLQNMTLAAVELLRSAQLILLRTSVHPGVDELLASEFLKAATVASFDPLYENAKDFEALYQEMTDRIVQLLASDGIPWQEATKDLLLLKSGHELSGEGDLVRIAYVTPGSPNVAERTVEMLSEILGEGARVVPAMSFVDMAFAGLAMDPFSHSVTLVDAMELCTSPHRYHGDLLVSQVWNSHLAQEVSDLLSHGESQTRVVYLYHLGLEDEEIIHLPSDELCRHQFDHLTSILVEDFSVSSAAAFIRLFEVVNQLRRDCPWDKKQTHMSLGKHLIEEAYEVVDAIELLDAALPRENAASGAASSFDGATQYLADEVAGELGDLVVQVLFHSVIAAEEHFFDLRFVLESITSKLIRRHPHVFSGLEVDGIEAVLSNWENIKRTEKAIREPAEGVPASLPALLFCAKLIRKAGAFGYVTPPIEDLRAQITQSSLTLADDASGLAELVFTVVELARALGVDLEAEVRRAARRFSRGFLESP